MAILNVSINLLSNNTFVKTSNDIKLLNSELGKTGGVLDNLKVLSPLIKSPYKTAKAAAWYGSASTA